MTAQTPTDAKIAARNLLHLLEDGYASPTTINAAQNHFAHLAAITSTDPLVILEAAERHAAR